MVWAGGGVGLAQGTGAGAASTSGAGAAGTLRTLLTKSVSRDTECRPGRQDGWMDGWVEECKRTDYDNKGIKK